MLAQQKDAYYQQEQALTKGIEDQRVQIIALRNKIEQWQEASQEANRFYKEEHARLQDAVRKKTALQSAHIAHHMLEQRALPQVIKELDKSLTSYFAHEVRGMEYVKNAADHIVKGN